MKPLVVGLCGGSGSGKTTVTHKLMELLDPEKVLVIQHDSYYKDISVYGGTRPDEINFDHPDALETRLLVEHLRKLRRGEIVDQPVYDFKTHHRLTETVRLVPRDVILLEGILLFVDEDLRTEIDLKVYLDADPDDRLMRRIRRDIAERGRSLESVMQQYSTSVKPMHLKFVEPSKLHADIIVPRGGDNGVAIDLIVTKIRSMR